MIDIENVLSDIQTVLNMTDPLVFLETYKYLYSIFEKGASEIVSTYLIADTMLKMDKPVIFPKYS